MNNKDNLTEFIARKVQDDREFHGDVDVSMKTTAQEMAASIFDTFTEIEPTKAEEQEMARHIYNCLCGYLDEADHIVRSWEREAREDNDEIIAGLAGNY